MTDTPTTQHYFPLSAIILPVFSIIAILLCLPPLIWHAKKRNIAASALIFWLILLNTNNFLNPLIWPTADWENWWMGQGYCDVQIRIMVGAIIGAVPACVLAISRSLAGALDTNRQMVHQDRRDKMKGYVFEAVLCFGLPIFYMVAYYVVQNVRYFIVPVYGCDNRYDGSWISVVLFFVPPVVMTLFSSYYTILVIYRMYIHRLQISTLLTSNKTTHSRFFRLFILSILILIPSLSGSIYALVTFILSDPITGESLHAYSWSSVHKDWNKAMLVPAGYGGMPWDRWTWVAYGYFIFFCFGVGEDARREYREWAVAIGFCRFFPSPRQQVLSELLSSSTSCRGSLSSLIARKAGWISKSSRDMSVDSSKTSCASESTAFELPVIEPAHQLKKESKWSSFVNMPGSFAQAVAGVQNLPQRPVLSASVLNSTSSAGMTRTFTLDGSTLGGSSNGKDDDYV